LQVGENYHSLPLAATLSSPFFPLTHNSLLLCSAGTRLQAWSRAPSSNGGRAPFLLHGRGYRCSLSMAPHSLRGTSAQRPSSPRRSVHGSFSPMCAGALHGVDRRPCCLLQWCMAQGAAIPSSPLSPPTTAAGLRSPSMENQQELSPPHGRELPSATMALDASFPDRRASISVRPVSHGLNVPPPRSTSPWRVSFPATLHFPPAMDAQEQQLLQLPMARCSRRRGAPPGISPAMARDSASSLLACCCAVTRGACKVLGKMRSSPDVCARCRLAVLGSQVDSTPSTLAGCLLFLHSPVVVVVHPR
jgi:hypothetical protein